MVKSLQILGFEIGLKRNFQSGRYVKDRSENRRIFSRFFLTLFAIWQIGKNAKLLGNFVVRRKIRRQLHRPIMQHNTPRNRHIQTGIPRQFQDVIAAF